MLAHAPWPYFAYKYDNWDTNFSVNPGTTITPGTGVDGSWIQIIPAAGTLYNCYGIYLGAYGTSISATNVSCTMELGIDPAGGTSYTPFGVPFDISKSPAMNAGIGVREFFFPLFIPAGATIAARANKSSGAATFRLCASIIGQPSKPEHAMKAFVAERIGYVGTPTIGTAFTPGNAAYGSYTSLGTTTRDNWWWQLMLNISNTAITNEPCFIELSWGDATTKTVIHTVILTGTTTEDFGVNGISAGISHFGAYQWVPSGSTIYVRGSCINAPDTGYAAFAVGFA